MHLRQSQLQEDLLRNQIHYDRQFAISQVLDDHNRKLMGVALDGILQEISTIRQELEPYDQK